MKIFDKSIAQEFQHILLFIHEVFSLLDTKGLKLKNEKLNTGEGEYGFYLYSKDKKSNIFFGLWMDCWVLKGKPCCIVLDSESRFKSEYKKRFIENVKKIHLYLRIRSFSMVF